MVKQLKIKKRTHEDDEPVNVVSQATRLSHLIDKRRRLDTPDAGSKGARVKGIRRSLGDSQLALKTNNKEIFGAGSRSFLNDLEILASAATRPLVDLYQNVVRASIETSHKTGKVNDEKNTKQITSFQPGQSASRPGGIMRPTSTLSEFDDSPSISGSDFRSETSLSARGSKSTRSSQSTVSAYTESVQQLKSLRQEIMISAFTPEMARRSQVTDFYYRLGETDPDARTRASINHMSAVLVKHRIETDKYMSSEGYDMSVRSGGGSFASVKRKLIGSDAGGRTPSKTPKRTANFDTVDCIRRVQKLANDKASDQEIAAHPSLRGLKLSAAQVSIMRTGLPMVDHTGPMTPGGKRRCIDLVGTPTGAIAKPLEN